MDKEDLKDIYSIFVGFTIVILFYGPSYKKISQMIQILATTNIFTSSMSIPLIHMPFYIKLAIIILLIPMIIDVWYDMVNISKTAKTQDEEIGELLKILVRALVIFIVILYLITSLFNYTSQQLIVNLNSTYINLTRNNG